MNMTILLRDRRRFEIYYRKQIAKALLKQIEPVIRDLKIMPPSVVPLSLDTEAMTNVIIDINKKVGVYFSDAYRKRLIGQKSIAEGWESYFETFILPILNRRTYENVRLITDTTRDILRRTIDRGISEGFGIDKIADFVREEMMGITSHRAKMIAQTEVIAASNQASFEGANSAGIKYKKFWSNSGLANVRESHIMAQDISYSKGGNDPDEPFDMGNGNFLMHPCDPNGPPEDVINCHCSLIIEPE